MQAFLYLLGALAPRRPVLRAGKAAQLPHTMNRVRFAVCSVFSLLFVAALRKMQFLYAIYSFRENGEKNSQGRC